MSGVSFAHVSKSFGAFQAVNDVSFEVEAGEFLVLVGPSGCGKTTALRMVAGLEDPTAGEIRIGDRVVNDLQPRDRDIAMVFQSYALYPHMTVFDNLAFGLKQRKQSDEDIRAAVARAAEMLGLGELLHRKPKELSGGQRQRVALGRAIVRQPAVFLMDEPLSNLDAHLRLRTRAEITALHRRLETTVLYVTHDQTEAMTMGTRIAVLKDGVLQQIDTPQHLYAQPANTFVATFIGSPAMNLFVGDLEVVGESLRFVCPAFSVDLPPGVQPHVPVSGGVTLGVRSEHIRLDTDGGAGSLRGTVTLVEPLGSDTYVTVTTEGQPPVVARLAPDVMVRAGDQIGLRVEVDAAHLFDAATGARV